MLKVDCKRRVSEYTWKHLRDNRYDAVKSTSKKCLVKHANRIEVDNFNVLVMGCGDASYSKQDRNNLLMLCCKTSTVATSGVRWKISVSWSHGKATGHPGA